MALWRGKDIVKLENDELVKASSVLEAMDTKNIVERQEAAIHPRYIKNNKNTALGNRNPVFDEILNEVLTQMKTRNLA